MRRDGDHRDDRTARSEVPEHPESRRRLVLGVRLPHLLAVGPLQAAVLVAVQPRIPRPLRLEQPERLANRLQPLLLRWISLERRELRLGFVGQTEGEAESTDGLVVSGVLREGADAGLALLGLLQPAVHTRQRFLVPEEPCLMQRDRGLRGQ